MSAWSSDPLPVHLLANATPLVRQGAAVFQAKQCRNCHSIGGAGGERGPALDNVATRLTIDQMRFKVVTGGGNMPAYGKNLSPAEIEALVSFLETLHPANEPPAYDASRRAVEASQRRSRLPQRRARGPASPDQLHERHHHNRRPLHPLGHSLDRDLRARLIAFIYMRGWARIRRTRPAQFPAWRLAVFLGGIVALFVAVASPLDTFSESLLFMHMAQHFVLMSVAPPLIVLGAPVVPMLRGLPRIVIRRILRPLFVTRSLFARRAAFSRVRASPGSP